ncbi:MAG: hypothetical protein OEQ53_13865 [Saprospiraceae bacterium]|nr:hypothetical protein [Saprospiraceae bacterium]
MTENPREESLQIIWLELTWWLITGLATGLVLFPILRQTHSYPFTLTNALFVIVLLTLFRYVFFLRFTFLRHRRLLKIILVFLSIPLIFLLIANLNHFLASVDERSIESFLPIASNEIQSDLAAYIRSEMILFGVGSILISIIFPFRMIISIWRQHNRGSV